MTDLDLDALKKLERASLSEYCALRNLARYHTGLAIDHLVWWLRHSVHSGNGDYPLALGWQIFGDAAAWEADAALLLLRLAGEI